MSQPSDRELHSFRSGAEGWHCPRGATPLPGRSRKPARARLAVPQARVYPVTLRVSVRIAISIIRALASRSGGFAAIRNAALLGKAPRTRRVIPRRPFPHTARRSGDERGPNALELGFGSYMYIKHIDICSHANAHPFSPRWAAQRSGRRSRVIASACSRRHFSTAP